MYVCVCARVSLIAVYIHTCAAKHIVESHIKQLNYIVCVVSNMPNCVCVFCHRRTLITIAIALEKKTNLNFLSRNQYGFIAIETFSLRHKSKTHSKIATPHTRTICTHISSLCTDWPAGGQSWNGHRPRCPIWITF